MDAAIRKAKDSLGGLFDKNLHDLVRGIRNHKDNEAKYISECIEEIKQELKQDNIATKANAINKLCYLEMLGYDISWAAFNIIEVMSSNKFTYKRIGYLAASQTFHEGTDVLMLTTNMIRKDLCSQNMYDTGIALSGLSCFVTPDLARDLANEIMSLMSSSKPYIRKKAVQIMYKIFLKYPDALRPAFPRLKEKLDDSEPSVQAAAVNVICELARKNPKNYLSLAPVFFKLMTVSTNNWVLIKIIKLFGALTPLEPRLGKKLIEPLTNLINSTSAMSLLYECINTVLAVLISISSGQPNHNSAIQICLQKLRILIEDSDQNLKYLGLLAMSKILLTNPKSVQAHKDLIMQCLDDKDESIRLRSLDLLYGMVSKKNLMEIIKKLMLHMNKAEGSHYRDELLAKIVDICSQNNYHYITSFEWYVSVLVELTRMEGTRHGKLLSAQMLDVAIRVESIRPFIVSQMSILLDNIHVFTATSLNTGEASSICEVLYAATWICGEFAEHVQNPNRTMEAMLISKVNNLPGHIQAAFVHNVFKLYSHLIGKIYSESMTDVDTVRLSADDLDECRRLTEFVLSGVSAFELNADIEVQERACTMVQVLKYVQKMLEKHLNEDKAAPRVDLEVSCLFEGDLNPVALKAQKKVPIPDGLDLDEWINDPPSDDEPAPQNLLNTERPLFFNTPHNQLGIKDKNNSLSSSNTGGSMNYGGSNTSFVNTGALSSTYNNSSSVTDSRPVHSELSNEELNKLKENRRLQNDNNPFYIKSSTLATSVKKSESSSFGVAFSSQIAAQVIRSQSIELKTPLSIPGVTSSENYYRMSQIDIENKKLKKKMKVKDGLKKNKKNGRNDINEELDDEELAPVVKILENEMPEGARLDSDNDSDRNRAVNDPHRALNINLDEPLKEDEKLPTPTHRVTSSGKITISPTNTVMDTSKISNKKKEIKSKKENRKSKKAKKTTDEKTESALAVEKTGAAQSEYNELLSPDTESPLDVDIPNTGSDIKLESVSNFDFWIPELKDAEISGDHMVKKPFKKKKKTKNVDLEEVKKDKKEKKKDSKLGICELTQPPKQLEKGEPEISELNGLGLLTVTNLLDRKLFLVTNKDIEITYVATPYFMNLNQLLIDLHLKSLSPIKDIYQIELNILDTPSIKLIREDTKIGDAIKIPFRLSALSSDHVEYYFDVSDCTYPQVLKGTFTYMIMDIENGSIHEKVDFKMQLPCSTFLLKNATCDDRDFARWLTSGQLSAKHSVKCEHVNLGSAQAVTQMLCSRFNISVVETADNCASLYSSSTQNHPVCILVKFLDEKNSFTVDGRSNSQGLIQSLLEEFRALFSAP